MYSSTLYIHGRMCMYRVCIFCSFFLLLFLFLSISLSELLFLVIVVFVLASTTCFWLSDALTGTELNLTMCNLPYFGLTFFK